MTWHRTRVEFELPLVRRIGDENDREFVLHVSGTYEPPWPGSEDDPPNGEGFEIEELVLYPVTWTKEAGHGIDLQGKVEVTTAMFTPGEIETIERAGIEEARGVIARQSEQKWEKAS